MINYTFPREYNNPISHYVFENAFSPEELQFIYDSVDSLPFQPGTIMSDDISDIRKSRIKWIPQEPAWDWLYERLIAYAHEANQSEWGFELLTAPEQIQYTEYLEDDNGKYEWHQDIGPGVPSLRKVSVTVQLSHPDEYEGGDLQMWMGGDPRDPSSITNCTRGHGTVVVFPSYVPHQVTPVTKGTRRSFVLWVGGEHYK